MKRREFIITLGGAAAAWPLAARAQQPERVRRIAVLVNFAADDREAHARLAAFQDELRKLGWIEGGNIRLDIRWGAGNDELFRRYANELVALTPDVILGASGGTMPPLLQATRTIPIVFAQVIDPVGNGFVASLARPGGNATGFTQFEVGMSGKWLEILKEIAPRITRAAVLRDTTEPAGIGQWGAIQVMAPFLRVEAVPVGVRDTDEIKRALTALAGEPNGGVIVTASAPTSVHRVLIISLAAHLRLPTVYPYRYFAVGGGLISYGPEPIDQFRRAAGYVDRILKGRSQATCRCKHRPSTIWSSTSRLPRRSASKSRRPCLPAPTR
jgi:putative tryptophan/tyrosine transport system substrate-binding protein